MRDAIKRALPSVRTLGTFLLGAVSTTSIGWYVQTSLNAASPSVTVTSIACATPTPERLLAEAVGNVLGERRAEPGARDAELIALAKESLWVPSLEEGANDAEYRLWLSATRGKADEVLHEMGRLAEALRTWPTETDQAACGRAYDILRSNGALVEGHVFGEVKRGATLFPTPAPEHAGPPRLFTMRTDSDGDFHVSRGVQNWPVIWSVNGTSAGLGHEMERVAKRMAEAVAYCDFSELEQLRQHALVALQEQTNLQRIRDRATAELDKLSRWSIMVTVSNDGREPIALAPEGRLYINAAAIVVRDDAGATVSHDGVIAVDVRAVSTKDVDLTLQGKSVPLTRTTPVLEPILVPAQTATTLRLESVSVLAESSESDHVLRLFRGPGCDAIVALRPLLRSSGGGAIYSEAVQFRDIDAADALPLPGTIEPARFKRAS